MKRWGITLAEVEHDGDLEHYRRSLAKVGATIVDAHEINEDSESVRVTIEAPAETADELRALLDRAEVCY